MLPLEPSLWKELVRPGSRIFIHAGAATPRALVAEFLKNCKNLVDLEVLHFQMFGADALFDRRHRETFRINSLFLGPELRDAVNAGEADYTPAFLFEVPRLFREGVLPPDVALLQVSPADRRGYHTLGIGVDVAAAAALAAPVVIAQVNPRMPFTNGPVRLHRRRIAAFIEVDEPLPEWVGTAPTTTEARIAAYVSTLVENGATLQVGVGRLHGAIVGALRHHQDLGLHTEMLSDVMIDAIEKGVVTNRKKTIHRGKTIATFCVGTRRLYDYLHRNPKIELHPCDYVNDPAVIAKNRNMVAINGALQVDLTGQVVSDSVGDSFHSGFGGQLDFVRGASLAEGGIPIIALPSTALNGTVSRIVPRLTPGSGVVTTRGDVHYIVTEYGVATLRGRPIRERALALIQVAHPKFREKLLEFAKQRKWLPPFQTLAPLDIDELGGVESERIRLKDGVYTLRPLHPSDERRLQEFFYSHTQETIQQRYGYQINRMTRERAHLLVSVDQSRDLALGVFETQGPREVLHSVGRYFMDDGGAELAFVTRESKRGLGMANRLFLKMREVAARRGVPRLYAQVNRSNKPMLSIFLRHGFKEKPIPGADAVEVSLKLKS